MSHVRHPERLRLVGGAGLGFVAAMAALVTLSRGRHLFESKALEEVERERPSTVRSVLLAGVGLAVVAVGGELVAKGAEGVVASFRIPPLLVGMVIGPAAIELEEVIRQAVPTREGQPEVAAGNLLGTALYFLLFNLGLIALATPVDVLPLVRTFDWHILQCRHVTGDHLPVARRGEPLATRRPAARLWRIRGRTPLAYLTRPASW